MSILVVLLSLAAGAYALAVIERWAVHGHLSLTGPAWAALALMGRESLLARKSDRLFFELGPVLLLVAGLMAVAVIPLAPGLIITDLATGALFLNAALAYVLVALIMAGWGPNGAFAMIAGAAVHCKSEPDETFIAFLPLIEAHAGDDRNFVKKAVNWALRNIGMRNRACHQPALALAEKLAESDDRTRRWVGRDAVKYLSDPKRLARLKG